MTRKQLEALVLKHESIFDLLRRSLDQAGPDQILTPQSKVASIRPSSPSRSRVLQGRGVPHE